MFGLAYSISRDNETGASRQIAYTPIGINKYLLSKLFPYLIIGIFESLVLYALATLILGLQYSINFFLIEIFTILFLTATLTLGLLFSMMKNQIATALSSIIAILLPVFASFVYITNFPIIIQIGLYALPITSFMPFLNYAMFNGVILWKYVLILLTQIIIYYFIVVLIMKKEQEKISNF
jgi:ABC-2 type transport system permease protein